MGQEISQQQNRCSSNIVRRPALSQPQTQSQSQQIAALQNPNFLNSNEKFAKKDLIYRKCSISTTSSATATTDDEHYRQRQKYNLPRQSYEKTKIAKKLSFCSSKTSTATTTASDISDWPDQSYQQKRRYSIASGGRTSDFYENFSTPSVTSDRRLGTSSQSTDSGIYYSSCHCSSASSAASSSSVSSTSGCATSLHSHKSDRSLIKQKQYLTHHLYIKSYLDILEEDEKARANFKPARPGGIRNYTPKILAETKLSVSAPVNSISFAAKQRAKIEKDPWI